MKRGLRRYLSSRRRGKSDHVSKGRNNVDSEADEQRADGGVDWPKEREYDGQEPNWDHHWQSC